MTVETSSYKLEALRQKLPVQGKNLRRLQQLEHLLNAPLMSEDDA